MDKNGMISFLENVRHGFFDNEGNEINSNDINKIDEILEFIEQLRDSSFPK